VRRNLLSYFLLLLVFGSGICFVLISGSRLEADGSISAKARPEVTLKAGPEMPLKAGADPALATSSHATIGSSFYENIRGPLGTLLLQVVVIMVVARAVGLIFRRVGQPTVVGEMIAGIIVGPSVLGALFPNAVNFLFPASSIGTLRLLSQLGVIIFMFVVGMELNAQHLHKKAHAVIMVSHASIVIPLFLGVALSLVIYPYMAPASVSFVAFALFIGIAMSITAFPVLARIIEERNYSKSYLGSTALACAAVDDVTGWCLLAIVVAIAKAGGAGSSLLAILLTLILMAIMLFVAKPLLPRLVIKDGSIDRPTHGAVAGILALVLMSAWFAESIGIHALFGAFLAGVCMPRSARFRSSLRKRIEPFTTSLFLPIFFVFTGLRTQIGLLNDVAGWLFCCGVISVAIAGKLGGSAITARLAGISWRESLSIGVLMNTRGLMELVVLNIGYDLGILSARVFAMMVIMALITTGMTGPLLALLERATEEGYFLVQGRLACVATASQLPCEDK
jgi:Kef-type K+ transport system membrane component KefB